MKLNKLKSLIIGSLTICVTLSMLSGCGNQKSSSNAQNIAKISVNVEPDNLDPLLSASSDTAAIMMNVFESLVTFNEKGEIIPGLAEKYDITDDGLKYTFTLKEDVKFHDGKAFSSKDVMYTYKKLTGLNGEKPLSSVLSQTVKGLEAPDDKTFIITLNHKDAAFITKCTSLVVEDGYNNNSTKPIGTGPFKFSEYVVGQKVVLERNKEYSTDKNRVPSIDKAEFKIMNDNNAKIMALKSGNLNIAEIESQNIDSLKKDYNIVEGPQNMVQLVAFNNSRAPFDNEKVREAINYAIDKDEIIKIVANGRGTKLDTFLSPIMQEYYNKSLKKNEYNIEKSKELLKEAGFEKGLSFKLTVPSNYQFHVNTAQVVKDQLNKVGINVDIELIEWAKWLEQVYTNADYQATIVAHTGKLDPQDFLNRFSSSYGKNYFKFSDEKYDELIEKSTLTTDINERKKYYDECQQILIDKSASVFIQDPNLIYVTNKNVSGLKNYPVRFIDLSSLKIN